MIMLFRLIFRITCLSSQFSHFNTCIGIFKVGTSSRYNLLRSLFSYYTFEFHTLMDAKRISLHCQEITRRYDSLIVF